MFLEFPGKYSIFEEIFLLAVFAYFKLESSFSSSPFWLGVYSRFFSAKFLVLVEKFAGFFSIIWKLANSPCFLKDFFF